MVHSFSDESSERSSITTTMTSVPDIMRITSTVDVFGFESTQSDNAMTEQNNSGDDTSLHSDVTQQASNEGGDAITNSLMPDDNSSKPQSDSSTGEESIESPARSTRVLSSTAFRDEASTSSESISFVSSDDALSSTDHSDLIESNGTSVSSNEMAITNASSDSASTGIGQASQQSTNVSLVLEESTTPRNEQESGLRTSSKVPVSSHLTEHRSLSTTILDSRSFDSYASTHTPKESSTSTSTSTARQYTWKTSTADSSKPTTLQPSTMTSAADKIITGSMEEGTDGGGRGAGYAIGAAMSCLLLILIIVSVLIIYRKARKKTHGLAEHDVTDYRSLVKSPSKRQDNDGPSASFEAFPSLPIIEEIREEVAIDIPLSATSFQLNGSKQKETSDRAKEIPMEDISEASAGNSESYSFNSFKPSYPKSTYL